MKTSAKENIGGFGRALLALWLLLFPLAAAVSAAPDKTSRPRDERAPALAPAAPTRPPAAAPAPGPRGVWGKNRVRGSEPFVVLSRWGELFVIPDPRRGCVWVIARSASGRVDQYIFVQNNPVNLTDPSGMVPERSYLEGLSNRDLAHLIDDYEWAKDRAFKAGKDKAITDDMWNSIVLIREVLASRPKEETNSGVGTFASTLFSEKSLWHLGFAAQGFARQGEDTLKALGEGVDKLGGSFEGITDTTAADVANTVLPGLEQRAEALSSYETDVVADAVGRTTWDAEQAAVMYYGPRALGAKPVVAAPDAAPAPASAVPRVPVPGEPDFIGPMPAPAPEGSFSIFNWEGYPSGLPRPPGPFRLLTGEAYEAARNAANAANRAIHKANPGLAARQIHEVQPVKFGGSPTDPANKVPLLPREHAPFTNWWNRFQRRLEGGGG